jgi:hypothetical protein
LKSQNFVCSRCKTGIKDQVQCTSLDTGNGVVLKRVALFCYLEDMLDEGGVIARIGKGWSKFRA